MLSVFMAILLFFNFNSFSFFFFFFLLNSIKLTKSQTRNTHISPLDNGTELVVSSDEEFQDYPTGQSK